MPKVKSANTLKLSPKSPAPKKSKDDESLLEFEQFITKKPKKTNNRLWLFITLIFVVIILSFAWFFTSNSKDLQKEYKFKAIYLENDQVYYAKVVKEDALNIYLDDVYYIQMQEKSIPSEEEGGEPSVVSVPVLIKRGQELHQPTGWMQLNRDKVIAVEEIGENSEILKEINKQEAK